MTSFFSIPAVQIFLLPFLGTVLLAGFIRLAGREKTGISLANAAVGAGFAWVCALVLGTPVFPPAFNGSAILSATVSLLTLGIVLDLWINEKVKFGRLIETTVIILTGIAIIAWMRAGLDAWSVPFLLGWGAIIFSLQRVSSKPEFGSGGGALMLAIAALGLAILAWISDIAVDQDLAFGLAATSFGFFVWNWPKSRLYFGHSILLAAGGGLYMIALRLMEQAPPLVPAIFVLGFIFFADNAVAYFPQSAKLSRFLPISLKFLTLTLIPLVLAALAALIAIEFPVN